MKLFIVSDQLSERFWKGTIWRRGIWFCASLKVACLVMKVGQRQRELDHCGNTNECMRTINGLITMSTKLRSEIITFLHLDELILTDGWYTIHAVIDNILKKAVTLKRICTGMKLHIVGAQVRGPCNTSRCTILLMSPVFFSMSSCVHHVFRFHYIVVYMTHTEFFLAEWQL